MDVVAAVKSGRDFRRAGTDLWYSNDKGMYNIPHEDLIAADWEIEEIRVTINKAQFNAAWDKAIEESKDRVLSCYEVVKAIMKNLGLE